MRTVVNLALFVLMVAPSFAQVPQPVVLGGKPALQYAPEGGPKRSQGGITHVTRVIRDEKPALRFEFFHGHGMSCGGVCRILLCDARPACFRARVHAQRPRRCF